MGRVFGFIGSSKFSRFCLQFLASILVIFALIVSLIRGLLPHVDQARSAVVDYFSQQYHIQVDVGQLSAKWQAFGPSITINNLLLPVQHNLPIDLSIGKVSLKLDFWQTLFNLSPQVEDVVFDDVKAKIYLEKINALTQPKRNQSYEHDWLYQLLLSQLERYSINDVGIYFQYKNQPNRAIHIHDLHWLNTDNRHRGQGVLSLGNDVKNEILQLNVDLTGDANDPDSIAGQIYLAATSLNIGKWVNYQGQLLHHTKAITHNQSIPMKSLINMQAWFDVRHRQITSGYMHLLPSSIAWKFNDNLQKLTIDNGDIFLYATDNGWQIHSQNLALYSNNQPWSDVNFWISKKGDNYLSFLNKLPINQVFPLLPLVPSVSTSQLAMWQRLDPQGSINSITIQSNANQPLVLSANFDAVKWKHHLNIPGISNINGKLSWDQNELAIDVPKQSIQVDYGSHFKQILQFDAASFEGIWAPDKQTLFVPKLMVNNADINITSQAKVDYSQNPLLSLSAAVNLKNAAHADNYYPLKAMDHKLVNYLSHAIKKGQASHGKVLWHGELAHFPYQDHSGVFQAGFTLDKSEFAFDPLWPNVSDLSLQALFENDQMDLVINQGKLRQVKVDGAKIGIEKLGAKSLLKINANLATSGQDATDVMMHSPLAKSVGATLKVVNIKGNVNTNLNIAIPLYDGDKTDVKGRVNIDDSPIFISEPNIKLNDVSGEVSFENSILNCQSLSGQFLGQPLTLSFFTQERQNGYALNVNMQGKWQLENLPNELINPLSEYFHGQLDWSGLLTIVFDKSGYRLEGNFSSDLQGVSLDLPAPFTKSKKEILALKAKIIGDNKETYLGVTLGNKAEFWGRLAHQNGQNKFSYYNLVLGRLFDSQEIMQTKAGQIDFSLPQMQLSQWLPIITGFTDTQGHDDKSTDSEDKFSQSLLPPLLNIVGNIETLNLYDQQWQHVKLIASPTEHVWRVAAVSNAFDGRIDFYPDWQSQGLKIVARKLYLSGNNSHKLAASQKQKRLNIDANLPPLAIDVDDFRYDNRKLGHLTLQGTPTQYGYFIQTLSLKNGKDLLTGDGYWRRDNGNNYTTFKLKLNADKTDELTSRLQFDPGIKDSPLTVNAKINWQGAPTDFSLSKLNGEMDFNFGKGHLSQVSDKGARLFSLFSLDSLLRKLSLDFSDVFGKGLYYDKFSGDLTINNGVVKTTNTYMDAIAGAMKVRGYTDLSTENLHYDIRFIPQLASSVPTVVLLSTSAWTMGIGAFALTKVLEPVIEVISEIRFQLTGTMSDPKLIEVERKSKEIEIPNEALPAHLINKNPSKIKVGTKINNTSSKRMMNAN